MFTSLVLSAAARVHSRLRTPMRVVRTRNGRACVERKPVT
jgi:hypothetical protein